MLIGAIYALARLAQTSQYTILRTGGLGPWRALSLLTVLGLLFALLTYVVGDYVGQQRKQQAELVSRLSARHGPSPAVRRIVNSDDCATRNRVDRADQHRDREQLGEVARHLQQRDTPLRSSRCSRAADIPSSSTKSMKKNSDRKATATKKTEEKMSA